MYCNTVCKSTSNENKDTLAKTLGILMKTLKVSVSRKVLFCSLFYRIVMVQLVVACLFHEKVLLFFILSSIRLLQS